MDGMAPEAGRAKVFAQVSYPTAYAVRGRSCPLAPPGCMRPGMPQAAVPCGPIVDQRGGYRRCGEAARARSKKALFASV
jgi:hypothetical protein